MCSAVVRRGSRRSAGRNEGKHLGLLVLGTLQFVLRPGRRRRKRACTAREKGMIQKRVLNRKSPSTSASAPSVRRLGTGLSSALRSPRDQHTASKMRSSRMPSAWRTRTASSPSSGAVETWHPRLAMCRHVVPYVALSPLLGLLLLRLRTRDGRYRQRGGWRTS